MRILFFISVLGHGRGGHFHSLFHISNALSKSHKVGIVSIGPGDNSTISKNLNYINHIPFNGINVLKLKHRIDKIISTFNPEILHCFDLTSYNVIAPLYLNRDLKLVVSKCGGPNPAHPKYFPPVNNLILFSKENKIWFENNERYKNTNIALIPNRVLPLCVSPTDINKPIGTFSFVKIARIGFTYKKSILESINLIDILLKRNSKVKIKLFIIGVVESSEVLEEILSHELVLNGTVIVLTEDKYTRQASKMLYLADAAIATGRGVMEATSLQLPVLTVNSESHLPILLTKNTFEDAFKTNFSERNTFKAVNDAENLKLIERLIKDNSYYQDISLYMKTVFDSHFNINNVSYKYEHFYNSIPIHKRLSMSFSPILSIKSLYTFYNKSHNIKSFTIKIP